MCSHHRAPRATRKSLKLARTVGEHDHEVDQSLTGVTRVESACPQAGLPMTLLGKDFEIVLGNSLLQVKYWPIVVKHIAAAGLALPMMIIQASSDAQAADKEIHEQDFIAIFDGEHWRLELMSSVSTDISLPVRTLPVQTAHVMEVAVTQRSSICGFSWHCECILAGLSMLGWGRMVALQVAACLDQNMMP